MNTFYDVLCVGAGPTGLACAIDAKRAGMRPLVLDKGCLCNSIYHYPTNLNFFTTSERMEIGNLPMAISGAKPTRSEALKYYRKAAEHEDLEVRLYERVLKITGHDGAFQVATESSFGEKNQFRSKKIILATGYYDRPNLLEVPGEELPHVSHYFGEPHPFWRQEVVVIGGKNSAAEAALELFRAGARVTLVHRDGELGKTLKYWVRPDIENRIRAREIRALFNTRVIRFERQGVRVRNGDSEAFLAATRVFAMTGYHPDFAFLEQQGILLDPVTRKPACNSDSLESNIPGMFLAGVLLGGTETGEIFIENGRFHGKQIISYLAGKYEALGPAPSSPPGE